MKTTTLAAVTAAAITTTLALPALSSGHAAVSALQPQGAAALLTSARTTYVLRVPNEQPEQRTWKVVMYVPGPVQAGISVRQSADWKVRLQRTPTGQKDADGNDVLKTTRISWTARNADAELEPAMFGDFVFRFQNPATPQALCFPVSQYYRNANGSRRRPQIVEWQGDPAQGAEFPKSCVSITK